VSLKYHSVPVGIVPIACLKMAQEAAEHGEKQPKYPASRYDSVCLCSSTNLSDNKVRATGTNRPYSSNAVDGYTGATDKVAYNQREECRCVSWGKDAANKRRQSKEV
jgi:hypothetical protein